MGLLGAAVCGRLLVAGWALPKGEAAADLVGLGGPAEAVVTPRRRGQAILAKLAERGATAIAAWLLSLVLISLAYDFIVLTSGSSISQQIVESVTTLYRRDGLPPDYAILLLFVVTAIVGAVLTSGRPRAVLNAVGISLGVWVVFAFYHVSLLPASRH